MKRPSVEELVTAWGRRKRLHRFAAVAAVVACVLVAYTYWFATADVEENDALNAQIADATRQRTEHERFSKDYVRYEQELSRLKERLQAAHEVLPDDADLPQLLATLGAMAHDLEVVIERLEPKAEVVKEFYADLGLHVAVRGSFHQVATLIDQIGNLKRIVTVENVSMKDAKTEDDRVSVEGQFDLHAYRFLTESQMAEAAANANNKAKQP